MKIHRTLLPVALVLLWGCDRPAPQEDLPVADLLLINADVVTGDPDIADTEAVAIDGELILAVGTAEELAKYRGDDTDDRLTDGVALHMEIALGKLNEVVSKAYDRA